MKEIDLDRHVRTAEQILASLSCPRALTVVILMRHAMWDEIANLQISATNYADSESFFRAYQATRLLSKAKWLPTTIDTRAAAVAKFEEAEELCRRTNLTWAMHQSRRISFLRDDERLLFSVRRKIGDVLGSGLFRWTEFCNFGPGADGSTVRGLTSAYNKLSSPGSVTGGAYPYLAVFSEITSLGHCFVGDITTGRLDLELSRGNRVTFVPKSAKVDRPIAVEPRWNIWLQKGVGAYIRARLRSFGVNLDDQGLNQSLAIYGSRTDKYATIDLASASDTMSKEVVAAVMPLPWLTVLDALRSPSFFLDGKWRKYEKWSSMGNGYTFELESLLFWAICSSINPDVSVYGDDLIVPAESFDRVVQALDLFGFRVNPEKSFKSGPFRESCGRDAFNGDTVTPIYWKNALDDQGALSLVNQISVLAKRLGWGGNRSRPLRKVWKDLVYELPRRFQQRGPTTLSTVVHDASSEWSAVRRHGWDGVWLNVTVPVPRKHRFRDYNAALLSQFFQPSSDGFQTRDRIVWKKRTVFVPSGYEDIGLWV
jgi:hypothetical protein